MRQRSAAETSPRATSVYTRRHHTALFSARLLRPAQDRGKRSWSPSEARPWSEPPMGQSTLSKQTAPALGPRLASLAVQ